MAKIQNLPIPFASPNQQHLMHCRNSGKAGKTGPAPSSDSHQSSHESPPPGACWNLSLCSNGIKFMGTSHCKLRHGKVKLVKQVPRWHQDLTQSPLKADRDFLSLNLIHTELLHQGICREGWGKIHSSLLLNKINTGRSHISRHLFLSWSKAK